MNLFPRNFFKFDSIIPTHLKGFNLYSYLDCEVSYYPKSIFLLLKYPKIPELPLS